MRLLTLDSEQAAILLAACDAAHAIIAARRERVDPGGDISRTLRVSQGKMDSVKAQLAHTRMADLDEIRLDRLKNLVGSLLNIIDAHSVFDADRQWKQAVEDFMAIAFIVDLTMTDGEPNGPETRPG